MTLMNINDTKVNDIFTKYLYFFSDQMAFSDLDLFVSSNQLNIGDLYPTTFKVCFKVVSKTPQTIRIANTQKNQQFNLETERETGTVCRYLESGVYQSQVIVKSEDKKMGVQ